MGRKRPEQPLLPPDAGGATAGELSKEEREEFAGLIKASMNGDTGAAAQLVPFLQRSPTTADVVVGMTQTLQGAWIDYAASNAVDRFVIEDRTKKSRLDLLGDNSTPLERLLVDRIVICTLHVDIAERKFIDIMRTDAPHAKVMFYEGLMDRAQRRCLAAINALVQTRRLQLPLVAQLNMATTQVNISQPGALSSVPAAAVEAPEGLPGDDGLTVDGVQARRDVEHGMPE